MARFQFQLPWRRTPPPSAPAPPPKVVVGATKDYNDMMTFDNRNITSQAVLKDYDFDRILRDKQNNIVSLYE